ncbi:MAG: hypothetical protein JST86_21185 [Bacteroidetes bacterium]|nr:hypothetical protein [Bacteroidota bacterium]
MKKIIIALDGEHFPKGAFEFAKYINTQSEILLAGIFLMPVDYSKLLAYTSGVQGAAIMPEWLMKNDDEAVVSRNISLFEQACVAEGMHYRVHRDADMMALSSLVEETRYADLLLVSSELFYKNVEQRQPNYYLEELLKRTECPVMLVPESYTTPSQVILTYDGGESALFAIKHFAYLFPELTSTETLLLTINEEILQELPEYGMLTELLAQHYPNLQLQQLEVEHKKMVTECLAEQPESFIVMGAFSRSMLSALFRKSFAKEIIRDIKMPIFISHK